VIRRYFAALRALLEQRASVEVISLLFEERTIDVGLVRGDILFVDGSRLHVREFLHALQGRVQRYMYVYHYQDASGAMVFRYDNSGHYPHLDGAPHHKHDGPLQVVPMSNEPDLAHVLEEIETHLSAQ
jgi:hypothetical protein